MIRSFFIWSRTARRNNPDQIISSGENHRYDLIMSFPDRDPSLLVVTARSLYNNRPVENLAGIVERDAVFDQIGVALDLIPLEASRCEQFEF
jgi:hypothetical protein